MISKKIIIACSFVLVFTSVAPAIAQTRTASSSATPTKAESSSEVDKLKERVAERVKDMTGDSEKAISGLVQSISDKELVIKTMEGDTHEIVLDDTLTKYYTIGTTIRTAKQTDVEEGDYVFAAGPEINGTINANGVYMDTRFMIVSGKITEVDADEYTVNIITLDKNNITLDIQTRTLQEMLNIDTLKIEKIGFSKLKEGDSIHAVMKANIENPSQNRYDAEKILIIPNEYFLQ